MEGDEDRKWNIVVLYVILKIVGFLQRTDVPVHQNYIVKTKEEAINTKKEVLN